MRTDRVLIVLGVIVIAAACVALVSTFIHNPV